MFQAFLPTNPVVKLIRFERLEPMILDDEVVMQTDARLDTLIKARGLVRLEKTDPLSNAMAGIAFELDAEFYSDPSGKSAVMSLLDGSYGMVIYFELLNELLQIESFADALRTTIRIEVQDIAHDADI